ncbi:uncharacterized protein L201_006031 [Kwoniella dendrophila CBS 6074]|uniref:Nucleoside phosphatase n=1 Tax=Kwoniella dendrophila CBS 6074 TaxID=1295534 RepID=A0AAX4K0C8_9TREE
MAPSISSSTTHYALVIDAGSSGSRLQIYSWRDPDLERAEILQEVSYARKVPESIGKSRWWWNKSFKGKGKEIENVMEKKALRRLVRVGKGVQGDDWVKRVEPGISTIAPENIPEYLAPLLSHALRHIPPSQHHQTPIYILATAGMRLLPESTREAILKASCKLIKNDYPFQVEGPSSAGLCGENIRVISGEEEGMWGWVAVNYLMDGFGHAPDSSTISSSSSSSSSSTSSLDPSESSSNSLLPLAPLAEAPPNSLQHDSVTPVDILHHSPTFGFLDMGGASTQLAFSPSQSELLKSGFDEQDLRKVSLNLLSGESVEWNLFVASWLGFGTNRARERYTDQLLDKWKEQNIELTGTEFNKRLIEDPCLPLDLELNLNLDNKEGNLSIKGTGSFSECLNNLIPLLDKNSFNQKCPTEHCLFAGLPTPYIDFEKNDQRGFIGISEYWYTHQQVLGLGGIWDWGEWEKGMNEFCQKNWKDIEYQVEQEKGWRGSEADLSRLQMQCFKGAWISNILHEGIGIPRMIDLGGNSTLTGGELGETNEEAERRAKEKGLFDGKKTHFQSMDEIGETAISWTLGKMVIEASKAIKPRSTYKENVWSNRLKQTIPISELENKLQKMGIQTLWAYGFISFFILACLFNFLFRRRFSLFTNRNSSNNKRNRKSSISTNAMNNGYSLEEGGGSGGGFLSDSSSLSINNPITTAKSQRSSFKTGPPGRLRLWSTKFSKLFKNKHNNNSSRNRNGLLRNNSMPTSLPLNNLSSSSDSSQPNSPSDNSNFFIPANSYPSGSLTVPSSRPGSVPPENGFGGSGLGLGLSSSTSTSPNNMIPLSPSRKTNSSRSGKSRLTQPKMNNLLSSSSSGGWNDPPIGLLSSQDETNLSARSRESTIATTTTSNNAISRNSSRVNLSELGLAQRSSSRAGTPSFE